MKRFCTQRSIILALILLASVAAALYQPADLAKGFRNVPAEARPRMYWRVFGPAWTEPEVDRQLALLKEAGIGGVTVYFLYPVALDDPGRGILNQRFGSAEFLRTFAHAARKAASLGLRFSVNAGTGWPFGGPTVSPREAAQRLREIRLAPGSDFRKALQLQDSESLVAAFQDGHDVTAQARRGMLPASLSGELRLYVSGPTGMQVKRAAFGGEDPVLSHFDGGALEKWLDANVKPLLDAAPGLVEGIGCDSLEVYRSNWTADLLEEFKKRRGYDLFPRLPELFDDAVAPGTGIRFDFWRTLSELTEERFTRNLGDWCRRHGVGLEMEPYGTPPNPETAAKHITIPTGEHYEWKGFAVQRYVSSMAHITGRPVVGSEAWTWAGLPNRLGDSLSDLKLVSNMAFLLGANDLTCVDFPYSPEAAGSPGWLPYFGPVMGTANPQWRFFPALVSYIDRCQWMLRQGEPVRKVAVYIPVEDAFAHGPVDQMLLDFAVRDRLATGRLTSEFGLENALAHHSDLLHGLISEGFDFDGIDFWAVGRLGRTKTGLLEVGEASYEGIVLPDLERIDLDAFERIASFCRAGGTVVAVGRLPGRVPGLARARENERLDRLRTEVFGTNPAVGNPHACGKGRAVLVSAAGQAARALSNYLRPSVRMTPRPRTVGFVHRRSQGRDIYFLANVGPGRAEFAAEFPGPPRTIEIWDPQSGQIRVASSSGSAVQIGLPPRESIFIVAGGQTRDAEIEAAVRETGMIVDERKFDLEWSLSFSGPDAPPSIRLRELKSWTELPGGRFFSGIGTYRGNFDWSGDLPGLSSLRFGQVREAAEVRLNGRSLGVIFSAPFVIDLGKALRQGANEIEIAVANLPLNRFLGLPDEDLGPLRARFGARFPDPAEKKAISAPAPSGLIGGVWIGTNRRK